MGKLFVELTGTNNTGSLQSITEGVVGEGASHCVLFCTFWILNNMNTLSLKIHLCSGWVAQLVRALSQYKEVVGSVPSQGIYKN